MLSMIENLNIKRIISLILVLCVTAANIQVFAYADTENNDWTLNINNVTEEELVSTSNNDVTSGSSIEENQIQYKFIVDATIKKEGESNLLNASIKGFDDEALTVNNNDSFVDNEILLNNGELLTDDYDISFEVITYNENLLDDLYLDGTKVEAVAADANASQIVISSTLDTATGNNVRINVNLESADKTVYQPGELEISFKIDTDVVVLDSSEPYKADDNTNYTWSYDKATGTMTGINKNVMDFNEFDSIYEKFNFYLDLRSSDADANGQISSAVQDITVSTAEDTATTTDVDFVLDLNPDELPMQDVVKGNKVKGYIPYLTEYEDSDEYKVVHYIIKNSYKPENDDTLEIESIDYDIDVSGGTILGVYSAVSAFQTPTLGESPSWIYDSSYEGGQPFTAEEYIKDVTVTDSNAKFTIINSNFFRSPVLVDVLYPIDETKGDITVNQTSNYDGGTTNGIEKSLSTDIDGYNLNYDGDMYEIEVVDIPLSESINDLKDGISFAYKLNKADMNTTNIQYLVDKMIYEGDNDILLGDGDYYISNVEIGDEKQSNVIYRNSAGKVVDPGEEATQVVFELINDSETYGFTTIGKVEFKLTDQGLEKIENEGLGGYLNTVPGLLVYDVEGNYLDLGNIDEYPNYSKDILLGDNEDGLDYDDYSYPIIRDGGSTQILSYILYGATDITDGSVANNDIVFDYDNIEYIVPYSFVDDQKPSNDASTDFSLIIDIPDGFGIDMVNGAYVSVSIDGTEYDIPNEYITYSKGDSQLIIDSDYISAVTDLSTYKNTEDRTYSVDFVTLDNDAYSYIGNDYDVSMSINYDTSNYNDVVVYVKKNQVSNDNTNFVSNNNGVATFTSDSTFTIVAPNTGGNFGGQKFVSNIDEDGNIINEEKEIDVLNDELYSYTLTARSGGAPMKDIVITDVLPYAGDDNGSTLDIELVNIDYSSLPSGTTVYVSEDGNNYTDALSYGNDYTDVEVIKVDFGDNVLSPYSKYEVFLQAKAIVHGVNEPGVINNRTNISYIQGNDIAGDSFDTEPKNGTSQIVTTNVDVIPADVSIKKVSDTSTGSEYVKSGDTITYTLTATNNTIMPLDDVYIIDNIPAGTEYVENSASAENLITENNEGNFVWKIDTLDAGDSYTVSFEVIVTANEDDIDEIENTAYAGIDPENPENPGTLEPSYPPTVNPVRNPEIEIEKYVTDGKLYGYKVGDTVEYTIRVTNTGDVVANDIEVTDDLITDYSKTINTLDVDESKELIATMVITDSMVDDNIVTNTAKATMYVNDKKISVRDSEKISVEPKIYLVKSASIDNNEAVQYGDYITYTITAINDTNIDGHDIYIYDTAPKGTAYIEGSASNDTAELVSDTDGNIVWKIDTLGKGESTAVSFEVMVDASKDDIAEIENTAFISVNPENPTDPEDPDTSNPIVNQVEDPEISIEKIVTNGVIDGYEVGDKVTYTITVNNIGDIEAKEINVTDDLIPDFNEVIDELAIDESAEFEVSMVITEDMVNDDIVTNTANATIDIDDNEIIDENDIDISSSVDVEIEEESDVTEGPTDSIEPGETEEPTNPVDPIEPSNPIEPINPTDPKDPLEPSNPNGPEEIITIETPEGTLTLEPSENNTYIAIDEDGVPIGIVDKADVDIENITFDDIVLFESTDNENPHTGDNTNAIVLLFVSSGLLVLLYGTRKKLKRSLK